MKKKPELEEKNKTSNVFDIALYLQSTGQCLINAEVTNNWFERNHKQAVIVRKLIRRETIGKSSAQYPSANREANRDTPLFRYVENFKKKRKREYIDDTGFGAKTPI